MTVHWVLDQIPHVVRYNSGTKEIHLTVGANAPVPATANEVRRLLPIRAFSQKQLSGVSDRTAELQRFLEQPLQELLARVQEKIEEHRTQVRELYSKILARKQLKKDLARAKTALASLTERANALEKTLPSLTPEATKAIREHADRLREDHGQKTILNDLDQAKTDLATAETALMVLPKDLTIADTSPQAKLLRSIHQQAAETMARAIEAIRETRKSVDDGATEILGQLKSWVVNNKNHLQAHAAAQLEAASHKKQMEQLTELRKQEAEKQKEVADLAGKLQGHDDGEPQFLRLLDSWGELHRQRADRLEQQCQKLTEMSDGDIRAELVRGADVSCAIDELDRTLKGAYINRDKWDALRESLLEGGRTVEKWRELMMELRPLAEMNSEDVAPEMIPAPLSSWGLTDKQRRALLDKLQPDAWLSLVLKSLKDIPKFWFKTTIREIPFERASAGQQATALLKVLLNEGGGPLIIDQPEEDLDNAVVEQVVKLIWQAKQNRQILIASHNANLVVNGDAELVIHCDYASEENHSKGVIKHQGAIDVADIRKVITNVMEGGEKAFKLRRKKYGF